MNLWFIELSALAPPKFCFQNFRRGLVGRPEGKIFEKRWWIMELIIHWTLHGVLILLAVLLISFTRDGLTGLWVRRVYEMVYPLYRRKGGYMLLVDLDSLKAINNRGGHPAGDVALRAVAQFIRHFGGWLSFRFGGRRICCFFCLVPIRRGRKK